MAEKGHVLKESGVTTQERKEVEVGTLLLDNDKNQLFIKLSFVFELLGLNGYLKVYLKSRINKLPKKINNI